MGARSPSRRRRRQVDKCRDKSAQTIRHELRYARPAVLPSTGAPRASWNPLSPPTLSHSSRLCPRLRLSLTRVSRPGSRDTPTPDHPIHPHHHRHHHHLPLRALLSLPDRRVPLLPLRSFSLTRSNRFSPLPSQPSLVLLTLIRFVPFRSIPFRCYDPYLQTLGNEQPPSKTGSVTRPTIILRTWLR